MSLKLRVAESIDRLEKRLEALKYLAGHEVNVGLTDDSSERNRFILAVQEHGSPVMRIPPRPVIRPGLAREETRAEMAEAMMAISQMVFTICFFTPSRMRIPVTMLTMAKAS